MFILDKIQKAINILRSLKGKKQKVDPEPPHKILTQAQAIFKALEEKEK